MSDHICPHCHGQVPERATVCRGCQAEIEYGPPPIAFLVIAVISAVLGYQVGGWLPASMGFIAWIVGVGGFIAGSFGVGQVFEDRVVFKRVYRTK